MTYKDTWNNPKSGKKRENFAVFNKKRQIFFVVSEKSRTFASAKQKQWGMV